MEIEARVADFTGNIEDLARRYSPHFFALPIGRPDVRKYALLIREGPLSYQMAISTNPGRTNGYNFMITITGLRLDRCLELADDFQRKTSLPLRPAPEPIMALYRRLLHSDTTVN